MKTIRAQAIVMSAAAIAVVVLVGMVALDALLARELRAAFDQSLRARAEGLAALVQWDGRTIEFDFSDERTSWAGSRAATGGFAVDCDRGHGWQPIERLGLQADDAVVNAMADSAVDGLDAAGRSIRSMRVRAMVDAEASEHEPGETRQSGGEERTAAALPIRVTVSADRSPLDAQITQTRWLIISSALMIVACGATAVGLAIARGLRPLNRLSSEVAHIEPGSEHARLATARLPDELRPIASQVNALLDRAHSVIERERGFASAASHEFRTPIAEARMLLEVALRHERSEPEWRSTARSSLEVLARMQSLVDALLAAARHARVDMQALHQPSIEACTAITKIVDGTCVQLGRPRHSVTIEAPEGVRVQCSDAAFESIVGNLVRNALEYGVVDEASPVRIEVLHDPEHGRLRISVLNRANGLSHADLDRMFDPLWRKDAARAGDGHFGLGLSVARTLASAFGGSIIASMPNASTIRVDVELPAG